MDDQRPPDKPRVYFSSNELNSNPQPMLMGGGMERTQSVPLNLNNVYPSNQGVMSESRAPIRRMMNPFIVEDTGEEAQDQDGRAEILNPVRAVSNDYLVVPPLPFSDNMGIGLSATRSNMPNMAPKSIMTASHGAVNQGNDEAEADQDPNLGAAESSELINGAAGGKKIEANAKNEIQDGKSSLGRKFRSLFGKKEGINSPTRPAIDLEELDPATLTSTPKISAVNGKRFKGMEHIFRIRNHHGYSLHDFHNRASAYIPWKGLNDDLDRKFTKFDSPEIKFCTFKIRRYGITNR